MSASRRALALSLALTIGLVAQARADVIPYVIVTDTTLVAAFEPLAAAHAAAGLGAAIRTVQSIHTQYPAGRDDAERIRMFLQDAHGLWGTRFVLLGGDDPLVPVRRAFVRLSAGTTLPDILMPTDQYYACLAGTWNADGDSLWGELPYPSLGEPGDDVSSTPDLNVGRAPVTTPAEASLFVSRTLLALEGAGASSTVDMLLAATQIGVDPFTFIDYAMCAQQLLPTLSAIPGANPTRLYLNSAAWPGSLPESKAAVLSALSGDDGLAVLLGPGAPGIFVAGNHPQDDITYSDLLGLANSRAMVVWLLSAYSNQPGAPSIGAALIRAPAGGAVAVLGGTDIQFISTANPFMQMFFDQLVNQHAPTLGEALSQAIASFPYTPVTDLTRLTSQGTLLYGDPALPAPWAVSASTPVELALASAEATPDGVTVTWFGAQAAGLTVTVERSTGASSWSARASAQADGSGRIVFRDADVARGQRYGYRLRLADGHTLGEAWVSVPRVSFALWGPASNPVAGNLAVSFSLPDAAPARLELLDVMGRVLRRLEVGSLGPGRHAADLGAGGMPPPGVYLLRLTREGRSLGARVCVLR